VRRPVETPFGQCVVDASIGVSIERAGVKISPAELLDSADRAMDRAKRARGGRLCVAGIGDAGTPIAQVARQAQSA